LFGKSHPILFYGWWKICADVALNLRQLPFNTIFVYTVLVRNITLSAEEDLIEKARSVARSQRRSLNDAFREWLEQFTASEGEAAAARFRELMKDLRYVKVDRHYTRDEMNER
jgi:hypothetical protein